eukprot:4614832-Amphidinium_carterae.1
MDELARSVQTPEGAGTPSSTTLGHPMTRRCAPSLGAHCIPQIRSRGIGSGTDVSLELRIPTM